MKKQAVAAVSAVVLTAGLGVGVSQLASAETPTPSPSPSSSAEQNNPGRKGGGHRGEAKLDVSGLAGKLGVDETKLTEAITAARKTIGSTEKTKPSEQTQAEREAARTARQEAFAKALAAELGIDEAKVTTALDELRAERDAERAAESKAVLDQAVKDGKLTQAEADAVQKAADQGIVRIGKGGRGR
ncbi:MAG: hypothetical protein QM628_03890 [Propionicimonas sp.]